MGTIGQEHNPTFDDSVRKTLNRHGHLFQAACMRTAEKSRRWEVAAPEFPVTARSTGTKIDLVLKDRRASLYLVVECKRADPALRAWCFWNMQLHKDTRWEGDLLAERIERHESAGCDAGAAFARKGDMRQFDAAAEVPCHTKGDGSGGGRSAIEQAASQVCQGMSGLANTMAQRGHLLPPGRPAVLVPVVFTTAHLHGCSVDSRTPAAIEKGEVDTEGDLDREELTFLSYLYPMSPEIKHQLPARRAGQDLYSVLAYEFVRSIIFVQANSIAQFLDTGFYQEFSDFRPLDL